jgi:hypothetical protein
MYFPYTYTGTKRHGYHGGSGVLLSSGRNPGMDRLIVRRGKRGSVLLAVAVTLPALLLLAGINQHLHSGQHVHLPDGRRRTKPLRVTDQTEWHVNATNALAEWRSALLGNMLDLYKRTEAAAYNGSDTPIVRCERENGDLLLLAFSPAVM